MKRVRPARPADLPELMALAADAGRGMTTMPQTADAMAERIERSAGAFARRADRPGAETYFLVLEDDGRVVGTAGLFNGLGRERPFYSYRLVHQSHVSPELDVRVETDLLHLVNDFYGDTELGTLCLANHARGQGRGRLLSFSRLMLVAARPDWFSTRLMAEIRGWSDAEGRSPFWDSVGRIFLGLDFDEADRLSALDHRFIADLMPRYPIYVDLLPPAARAAIGRPNDLSVPAMRLLATQGFHYENLVDIFDAGPCVQVRTDHVPLIRGALRGRVAIGAGDPGPARFLCRADDESFCAVHAPATVTAEGEVRIDAATAAALQLGAGHTIVVSAP